ncbi:MAG: T9SS type A sorting domain-containing protein [Bacteroidia bacterium]
MKQRSILIVFALLLFSARVDAQSACNFQLKWQSKYPGFVSPLTLDLDNTGRPYIYAASNEYGLKIYHLDGTLAATVDTNQLSMRVMSFSQYGNLLYVAVGSHFPGSNDPPGVVILDITNPLSPVVLDTWIHAAVSGTSGCGIIKVEGNYAFVGAMGLGLVILDVSDPSNIVFVSETALDVSYPFAGPPAPDPKKYNLRGMEVKNKIVYGCYDAGGLRIINCTNVNAPFQTGRYANPITYVPSNQPRAYNNIVLNDTVAYVAVDYCGFEVLDIRDTSHIVLMDSFNPHNAPAGTWWTSPIHASELKYVPECKKVFMSTGKSEMIAMDVSNPSSVDSCGGYGSLSDTTGTWGIGMRNDTIVLSYLYVPICIPPFCAFPANWNGIKMLKWTDPCVPLTVEEKEVTIGSLKAVPNPFNNGTEIRFWLKRSSTVTIQITDVMGRMVRSYKQQMPDGENVITWNGKDHSGREIADGMYFARLDDGRSREIVKLLKSK